MASLHEHDFYGGPRQQLDLLKTAQLERLGVDYLIEELENRGTSAKRELVGLLEVLLMHWLKWQYQSSRRGKSWKFTLARQRDRIQGCRAENPSLTYPENLHEALAKAYKHAVRKAVSEMGLAAELFPKICPYSIDPVMDGDYYLSD